MYCVLCVLVIPCVCLVYISGYVCVCVSVRVCLTILPDMDNYPYAQMLHLLYCMSCSLKYAMRMGMRMRQTTWPDFVDKAAAVCTHTHTHTPTHTQTHAFMCIHTYVCMHVSTMQRCYRLGRKWNYIRKK